MGNPCPSLILDTSNADQSKVSSKIIICDLHMPVIAMNYMKSWTNSFRFEHCALSLGGYMSKSL